MARRMVRTDLMWQLVRYSINGCIVTGLYTIVYVALDSLTYVKPQICNLGGYLAAACTGYVLHSRVTFRGHGGRGRGAQLRFFLASIPSYALNAFWTWACTVAFHWPSWTPLVPIWLLTPIMLFALNRWWVFR